MDDFTNNIIKRINEKIEYKDNSQISYDLARYISGTSLKYPCQIKELNGEGSIDADIIITINEDDIETVESGNVVYSYIRVDKLDFELRIPDESSIGSVVLNMPLVAKANKFYKIHEKAWRDDNKLYLLKMNRNSGVIGRFDTDKLVFRTSEFNYLTSDNTQISRELLTKDYLQDYLSKELSKLVSPVGFKTYDILKLKENLEKLVFSNILE